MKLRQQKAAKNYYAMLVQADADSAEGPMGFFDDDEADADVVMDEFDGDDTVTDVDLDKDGETTDAQQPKRATKAASASASWYTGGYHTIHEPPSDPRLEMRMYRGPKIHDLRNQPIRQLLFGPQWERMRLIWDVEQRFGYHRLLPPRRPCEDAEGVLPSPWVPGRFEAEQVQTVVRWFLGLQSHGRPETGRQHTRPLSTLEGERVVPSVPGHLAVLVGPNGHQKELRFGQGTSMACSPSGLPVQEAGNSTPTGWLFNVGALVLELGWAPTLSSENSPTQLLAVAAVPFSDYDIVDKRGGGPTTDNSQSCVQFWEFTGKRNAGELASPSTTSPRLIGVKCFDWGRPKRMVWCPVPTGPPVESRGLLAVLCGGKVHVLDIRLHQNLQQVQYECMECPVVRIGQLDDNSEATCLAWINVNRMVLGHRDGSITLWSLHPRRMLQRMPIHVSPVLDVCSGYPSQPHLVASMPVGGCATMTDLTQPTAGNVYLPTPATKFQHGTLVWSEHTQSFIVPFPQNTTCLTMLHTRMFCRSRRVLTLPSAVTCASMGTTHPFLLGGSADGTLWATNIFPTLFRGHGNPDPCKLRVFESEFRPLDDDGHLRGAVRFMHGFKPEINEDPRRVVVVLIRREKAAAKAAKKKHEKKKTTKDKASLGKEPVVDTAATTVEEEAACHDPFWPDPRLTPFVVHEPLTRITAVAWNPNLDFSCWAACALGSGLVRVMDLGVP